jgi:hypothetical protein
MHTQRTTTLVLLLTDALSLSLFAFAGFMTLEGLMPGFIIEHLNLTKVLFTIALVFLAREALSLRALAIPPEVSLRKHQIFFVFLCGWSLALLINSLLKFPLFAIVIIVFLTIFIGKLFFDEFFHHTA